MILALALLLVPQADEPAHAFVELAAEPTTVFVEQPIRLRIRFGVEREYLRHNLLQLFTRPLEVPVQLELGWQAGLPNTLPLELDGDTNALVPHPSFALGEEIAQAARSKEEQRAGKTWIVLELERALLPLAPGRLEIPAPVLNYAFATRFGEDLVSGSVPLDRQMARVQGHALALEVLPLPAEGRPAGFGNAVGKFTLAVEVAPRELEAGEKLRLVLTIAGTGNLARLDPPRLDGFEGLHLLGKTEELKGDTRTLRCELVAQSPKAREVPAIVLDYFDPDARAYGRASTQPIPLQVRARVLEVSIRKGLYLWYGLLAGVAILLAWGIVRLVRSRRS